MECLNSTCSKKTKDPKLFKSCHYCVSLYCSIECRQSDWIQHKQICYFGRLASLCKKILIKIGRNLDLRHELSKIAYTGYQSFDSVIKKRGFVWLDFVNEKLAEEFTEKQLQNLKDDSNFLTFFGNNLLPKYVFIAPEISADKLSQNDMVLSQLFSDCVQDNQIRDEELSYFIDLLSGYIPNKEFLLLTSIKIDKNEIKSGYKPKKCIHNSKNVMYIFKFMKMDLKLELNKNLEQTKTEDQPLTLVLTSLNNCNSVNDQENRELFLANLLNEFQIRGINLRLKYPSIYRDLCLYVEENKPFTPVCLFPRDLNKNNLFMCLIMPNSEPINYQTFFNHDENYFEIK